MNNPWNPIYGDSNALQSLQQLCTAKQKCSQLVDKRFVTSSNRPAVIPHRLRVDYQCRFGMNIYSTLFSVINRRQLHYSVTLIPSNGRLTPYNCIGGFIISVRSSNMLIVGSVFTYIDSSTNQYYTYIDSSTNQYFTYIDSSTNQYFTYIDSSTN